MKGRQTVGRDWSTQSSEEEFRSLTTHSSKSWVYQLFLLNLQMLKVEEKICTMLVAKSFLLFYFFTTGMSLIGWKTLKNKHLTGSAVYFDAALRVLILIFVLLVIGLLIVGLFRPLKITSKIGLLD